MLGTWGFLDNSAFIARAKPVTMCFRYRNSLLLTLSEVGLKKGVGRKVITGQTIFRLIEVIFFKRNAVKLVKLV